MKERTIEVSTETQLESKSRPWKVSAPDRCIRVWQTSPGRLALQVRSIGQTTPHGTASRRAYSIAVLDVGKAADLIGVVQEWIDDGAELARRAKEAGR